MPQGGIVDFTLAPTLLLLSLVKLNGDDLSTFTHKWESVIAGLNHQPEETALRDLEVYDRAKEGEEKHTYDYLVKCVTELLERERRRVIALPLPKLTVLGMVVLLLRKPQELCNRPEAVRRRNLALHSNVADAQEARTVHSNM